MWHLISAANFSANAPTGGGIYRVHCFADHSYASVLPVQRVLGIDTEGVLYIGKADIFASRVAHLKKSILPTYRGSGHICGRRYRNALYSSLAPRFPAHHLCVSFQPDASPQKAEEAALRAYVQQFGELPPLNRLG
jgi:hypothetical protein